MFSPKNPEEFAKRLREFVENSPAKDVEKNLRSFGNALLSKSNLVTREEFDAQTEMLSRVLAKLETIEEKIRSLAESPPGEPSASGKSKGKKPRKKEAAKEAGQKPQEEF